MTREREFWVDGARFLAVLMVVGIHLSGPMVKATGVSLEEAVWWYGLTMIFKVAVPWFFVLSGYLVAGKSLSWNEFINRRLLRLIEPWLLWASVKFWLLNRTGELPSMSWLGVGWWLFIHAYWFMPVLLSWYMLIPLTWKEMPPGKINRRGYGAMLVLAIMGLAVVGGDKFWGYVRESEIVLYGMYLGFGVWLRKWPQPVRLSRIAGWLALVTYAWIMWQSLEKLVARGRFDVNWYVYTTVPIFVLSTSLLIWLRGWLGGMRVGEGVRRWVEQVSRMSLGFYLLQVPLMIGLGQFGVGRWLGSWWEIWPVRYVTVVGVMWVVLSGLGKVRWLGRWVY